MGRGDDWIEVMMDIGARRNRVRGGMARRLMAGMARRLMAGPRASARG